MTGSTVKYQHHGALTESEFEELPLRVRRTQKQKGSTDPVMDHVSSVSWYLKLKDRDSKTRD